MKERLLNLNGYSFILPPSYFLLALNGVYLNEAMPEMPTHLR